MERGWLKRALDREAQRQREVSIEAKKLASMNREVSVHRAKIEMYLGGEQVAEIEDVTVSDSSDRAARKFLNVSMPRFLAEVEQATGEQLDKLSERIGLHRIGTGEDEIELGILDRESDDSLRARIVRVATGMAEKVRNRPPTEEEERMAVDPVNVEALDLDDG